MWGFIIVVAIIFVLGVVYFVVFGLCIHSGHQDELYAKLFPEHRYF